MADPDEVTADAALGAAAEPLYALPPEEFVEARNARARQARSAGDRDLARRVTALPKPTVAAYLLNELARRRPDAVEQLVGLGGRLRDAQESLDGGQLRALTRQRQEVVAAFVRQVVELARDLGRPLSDAVARQVQETLRAAVADEAAGRALRSGRLTTALEYVGMGEVDVSAAMAAPRAPLRAPQPTEPTEPTGPTEPAEPAESAEPVEPAEPVGDVAGEVDELASARRRRRDAVAKALTEAEELAQAAADRLRASDRRLRDAQETATGLHDRVAQLRTELDRSVEAAEAADDEVQKAAQDQEQAATDATAARDVVERARADLDESP